MGFTCQFNIKGLILSNNNNTCTLNAHMYTTHFKNLQFLEYLSRGPVMCARSGREFPFQGFEETEAVNIF